jgi:geranylgeranyl diphosphate synthase type I
LGAIENELRLQVDKINELKTSQFFEMITSHMGWSGDNVNEFSKGKRIRPLLLLLCSASGQSGSDWHKALPGAAAVELIHNFSLIHDDIEDGSKIRRHKPTVWSKWGIPQAINTGDALYAMANLAASELIQQYPSEIVVKSSRIFHMACLNLTRGQFMDISFEDNNAHTLDEYWRMITNKTSALISASTEIGSILAGLDENQQEAYRQFGHYLGLAFQIKDDILGIWGKETKTGKSAINDLISRKKTLPVLFGIQKAEKFAKRWIQGNIVPDEVSEIAKQLEKEGGLLYAEESADRMSDMAKKFLNIMSTTGEAGYVLFALTEQLLNREA